MISVICDMNSFALRGNESISQLNSIIDKLSGKVVDDVEISIRSYFGRAQLLQSDLQARKFRKLKILTLWLQGESAFGKYCYYGCYCLPDAEHHTHMTGDEDQHANVEHQIGYGKPVDNIDKSCFELKQCYRCLLDKHGKDCKGSEKGYDAELNKDANGKRFIKCGNEPGSCRYNVCMCDKHLAEQLAKYESEWKSHFHVVKGDFDRPGQCERQPVGARREFRECCGTTLDFPLNQPRRSHQCCDGPFAKDIGKC